MAEESTPEAQEPATESATLDAILEGSIGEVIEKEGAKENRIIYNIIFKNSLAATVLVFFWRVRNIIYTYFFITNTNNTPP